MEPQGEDFIVQVYLKGITQMKKIWNEIGLDENNCNRRMQCVRDQIQVLVTEMVDKETKLKKKILADIERYGQQFYNLNKELEAGIADPGETVSLLECEEYLRNNVDIMMQEVKKRHSRLKELQTIEQELCERLIEEPSEIPKRKIPAKEDMEDLERKIRTLEQEKVSREKSFHHMRDQIISLMEDMEQKPNCSFEMDIYSGVDLFTLSQQNLQRMKEIKADLEVKVKRNQEESLSLRQHIERLWNRLEINEDERDEFLTRAGGHSPSTLTQLHAELDRLKVQQHQNIAKFINRLRRELEDWWEKCYISETERNSFRPYFADDYTEELLQEHDAEVQKLNNYYITCKTIFDKIEQRKQVWIKYTELEERANDPNRYGNRGGSLLREEKERKSVKKELPFIEKELEKLVSDWEAQEGRNFLISGMKVVDYINNEWIQHHERKENERKKKQSERSNQMHHEGRMGSKPPVVKRRRPGNDTLQRSKYQRVSEDHPSQIASSTSSNSTKRVALRERNPNSMLKDIAEQTSSEISSYSHFSEGIRRRNERENIRSSAASGIHKSAVSIYKPSPKRPPPGLPKTPKTVPRPPTRFSPRLSGSVTKSARRSSRTMTSSRFTFSPSSLSKSKNTTSRVNFSSAASPLFRSPRTGSRQSATPSKWNKLTFLI